MKKSEQPTIGGRVRNGGVGIPSAVEIRRALEAVHYEKISEPIPVKVPFTVKECVKQVAGEQGVSSWVRQAIIEKLERTHRQRRREGAE